MVQSSITAWLKKPAAVKEATPLENRAPRSETSKPPPAQSLPPIPPSSQNSSTATSTVAATSTTAAVPPQPILRPLPLNITLEPLTSHTIPSFRRLNSLLLPIPYPNKFYEEILTDPVTASITLGAFWHDDPPRFGAAATSSASTSTSTIPNPSNPSSSLAADTKLGRQPTLIGVIRCRLLAPDRPNAGPFLYLSTIGTLAPYRSHGVALHLLSTVTSHAVREYGISAVTAHAWEANTDGLEWYLKRGFKIITKEEGYYRRLTPSTALLLKREVGLGDAVVWCGRAEPDEPHNRTES